ncbi:MAG: citrate lyase subunit alpha [Bacilli bacterium]
MKNSINREVPLGYKPFISSSEYEKHERKLISEKSTNNKIVFFDSLDAMFSYYKISDGMTLSFHHHLRNGDEVLNQTAAIVEKLGLKNMHFAPSSIFPNNNCLSALIKNKNITSITTNYINGEVAKTISQGYLENLLVMETHGGRARSIESGELAIDFAILATPTVDKSGNGTGSIGKNACGALGYAIPDLKYAKKVVLVTDNLVDKIDDPEFNHPYVDCVVVLSSIGEQKGIVSGTTKITTDPVGLKIARDAAKLLNELGIIKPGLSMQTGAGGTSLAVAEFVKRQMISQNIVGSFASGGITSYFVQMLKLGLFERLYDVQCFDLDAVTSYRDNKNHIAMSSSEYGNPMEITPIVDNLDFVILGATEVDLNFNVNVTTDSNNWIIGGSGGHSDTAHGAKLTIITTNLIKSRMPIIKERVTTCTTPGEDVDVLVTERGIAINPKRQDLLARLKNTHLKIKPINELLDLCYEITTKPQEVLHSKKIIGVVKYRDGTIIDSIYQIKK